MLRGVTASQFVSISLSSVLQRGQTRWKANYTALLYADNKQTLWKTPISPPLHILWYLFRLSTLPVGRAISSGVAHKAHNTQVAPAYIIIRSLVRPVRCKSELLIYCMYGLRLRSSRRPLLSQQDDKRQTSSTSIVRRMVVQLSLVAAGDW